MKSKVEMYLKQGLKTKNSLSKVADKIRELAETDTECREKLDPLTSLETAKVFAKAGRAHQVYVLFVRGPV